MMRGIDEGIGNRDAGYRDLSNRPVRQYSPVCVESTDITSYLPF